LTFDFFDITLTTRLIKNMKKYEKAQIYILKIHYVINHIIFDIFIFLKIRVVIVDVEKVKRQIFEDGGSIS
jgi:hypothetical protein